MTDGLHEHGKSLTGGVAPSVREADGRAGGPGAIGRNPEAPDLFRVYSRVECAVGRDGYPIAWDETIKHLVRELAGHRCIRCGHPYLKGDGEWSPCGPECVHKGPLRYRFAQFGEEEWTEDGLIAALGWAPVPLHASTRVRLDGAEVEARWRILTVHHLNGVKGDCRWWNLVSLCQRCHLTIQGKVRMERPYERPHSGWFRPYAAGHYAFKYLGEELSRAEVDERLDDLLALELRQDNLFT